MKNARHVVQGLALDHHLPGRIDDCDFRIRLRVKGSGIRINVRAINPFSIRRHCQVAGATAGQEPFGFFSSPEIDYGHVAAEAISDVECRAAAIRNNSARFRPCRKHLSDLH